MYKFTNSDTLIYLPCIEYHYFHENCIKAWMTKNSTCPICKKDITEKLISEVGLNLEKLEKHFSINNTMEIILK